MGKLELFPKDKIVGIFRGFSQGGLEFHADIVLPYKNEFQSIPMHGQFLLVQLAHEEEAVLGRITSFFSDGRLASGEGEDYSIRAVQENRVVPDDLRDQYLKYRVNIRVLGVLRHGPKRLEFAASHRRLPHLGSKVAFPSDDVLREVAGHNVQGADLGFFALGEFIYGAGDPRLTQKQLDDNGWMLPTKPAVVTKFDISQIVSRRSFVFARAGFGKSNLTKLLFSNLYKGNPTTTKRNGRQVPVGTVIFDPDGEYFWPDDKNRPGLCDVPELENKVVVFTRRRAPSPFYQSFVAGDIRLDIRRLRPADVLSIALSPEQQTQQNVRKLKALPAGDWEQLVDEIDQHKNQTDADFIKNLLHLDPKMGDAEAVAARSHMTNVVGMLHSRSSQLMDMLLAALREGKLCIVDVSQLRGASALVLSGIILQKIFDTNQQEFTNAQPKTIPTIAVIEEAQSVLGSGASSSGEGPYVAWVKEGRKYDLGAVMVTQQPGSISTEILSQGDNWFIFHLLSAADLQAVRRANAHFSEDLLSALLNEPIPGHGVFWSSAGGRPYPLALRILSFEDSCSARDPSYTKAAITTYASGLRERFENEVLAAAAATGTKVAPAPAEPGGESALEAESDDRSEGEDEPAQRPADVLEIYRRRAVDALRKNADVLAKIRGNGFPWMGVRAELLKHLPGDIVDRETHAQNLVPRALNEVFGEQRWSKEKRPKRDGSGEATWIVVK